MMRASALQVGFTDDERRAIGDKLAKYLAPEYLSERAGPAGKKVSYIEGWKQIDLANETFGFDGWSTDVRQLNLGADAVCVDVRGCALVWCAGVLVCAAWCAGLRLKCCALRSCE